MYALLNICCQLQKVKYFSDICQQNTNERDNFPKDFSFQRVKHAASSVADRDLFFFFSKKIKPPVSVTAMFTHFATRFCVVTQTFNNTVQHGEDNKSDVLQNSWKSNFVAQPYTNRHHVIQCE